MKTIVLLGFVMLGLMIGSCGISSEQESISRANAGTITVKVEKSEGSVRSQRAAVLPSL